MRKGGGAASHTGAHQRAARRERATRRHRADRGRRACDRHELPARPGHLRDGGQQRAGVRMARVVEGRARAGQFRHPAAIEHQHAVGDLGDHAEIVGDEQDGEPRLALQVAQQRQDLRLDRHVERRGRLVGDQQPRARRERHRDHHALAHAAGHFVRKGVEHRLRARDLDAPEQRQRFAPRLGSRHPAPLDQNFLDLPSDPHDRVQRGHRLLEDHREIAPAPPAPGRGSARDQIVAVEHDAARGEADRARQQPHDAERQHALAAAGLADHAERLARLDGEPHVGQDRRARGERDIQPFDPQQRHGVRPSCADRERRAGRRRAD